MDDLILFFGQWNFIACTTKQRGSEILTHIHGIFFGKSNWNEWKKGMRFYVWKRVFVCVNAVFVMRIGCVQPFRSTVRILIHLWRFQNNIYTTTPHRTVADSNHNFERIYTQRLILCHKCCWCLFVCSAHSQYKLHACLYHLHTRLGIILKWCVWLHRLVTHSERSNSFMPLFFPSIPFN